MALMSQTPVTETRNTRQHIDWINVQYLVAGYARRFCPSQSQISESTLDLIMRFVPKMRGYCFRWKIEPTLSAPMLPSFDSDTFDVGLSNTFFLRLQSHSESSSTSNQSTTVTSINRIQSPFGGFGYRSPSSTHNGTSNLQQNQNAVSSSKVRDEGRFVLKLMSFPTPPGLKMTIIHFEIYCAEIDYHYAAIWNMNNMNSMIQGTELVQHVQSINNAFGSNKAMKLLSTPWTLPSDNISRLLSESGLTFKCTINVLKKDPLGTASLYNTYSPSYAPGAPYTGLRSKVSSSMKTISEFGTSVSPYSFECGSGTKAIRFLWEIRDSELRKLDHGIIDGTLIPKNAAQINSDVFGRMFQLKLWRSQETKALALSITLCGIPRATNRVGVKFQISAKDAFEGKSVQILSEIITLSFESAVFHLKDDQNAILQQIASDTKGLSLICKAAVIQKHDAMNNVVSDHQEVDDDGTDEMKRECSPNDHCRDDQDEKTKQIPSADSLVSAKTDFFEMKKETFLWKISDQESMNKLLSMGLDEQFLSDPFILCGHKWYLSVQTGNSVTRTAGWTQSGQTWRGNMFGSVNPSTSTYRFDTFGVHLNPIMEGTVPFDCRVTLHILQSGRRCTFYHRYVGTSNQNTMIRSQRSFLQQPMVDLKGFNVMDIVVEIEKINEFKANEIGNKEVESWLSDTLKLPEYVDLFKMHGVDSLEVIKEMTIVDFQLMGINKAGHRIRLQKAIETLCSTSDKPASSMKLDRL